MTVVFDSAVVGAGAAGLMAAITAARAGLKVLLLDSKPKIGAKILMSGGTRCNVTNQNVTERDYHGESPRILRNILRSFSSEKAVVFFRELGVELVLEAGGKYFPSTHSAKTILNALIKEVERLKVETRWGCKVTSIETVIARSVTQTVILSEAKNLPPQESADPPRSLAEDPSASPQDDMFPSVTNNAAKGFIIRGNFSGEFNAKTVILSTGGLSYPFTGSDGTGFEIAKKLGHSLIPLTPSLTPLKTLDADWKSLTGISTDCLLTLKAGNRIFFQFHGPILFTHFGFSGPSVLNLSRVWNRSRHLKDLKVEANFLPKMAQDYFEKKLKQLSKEHPDWSIKRAVNQLGSDPAGSDPFRFSERFLLVLLKKAGIDSALILNQISKEKRQSLLVAIYHSELEISDVFGYQKAEATAGGIPLNELNSKTLESQKIPGLFFAGEMLDVDGRIGGFNFQWAWSSGVAAARGAEASIHALQK